MTQHFAAMPLVAHIPDGQPGWRLVHCPECGAACWERPDIAEAKRVIPDLTECCTECAQKAGLPLDGTQIEGGEGVR
ncbi:hypothetical protein [Paenibacillus mucilaginosus]|uniref:Uncharacterized protein n=2 Tax=Paenibacillus mucilaginosus TaxID=61624 RepID=H6NJN4_9BACL|nr:hypothetical protein [Paenibacillus mucilaginosus]AEI41152.1 hypothetical protein KNP414_02591 [Paenibacillus mucilaginosus KNP414]AFC29714.1 hypothetical protein PM3016_2838 [Paenibacillus mucilaginosus 3016]MCG7211418.1 hypothetical protein [Paenibacillus mucilaginosus]WDM30204.1 hypothetical protein KCX80_14100 [Paenibacillus mucilaginosus]WFA18386.1 hypothetical protein ERY13_14470 [Paenibacillus mucilaginosus]